MHGVPAGSADSLLRQIEVFTQEGWLCTAYPQDQLTREQAEAVIAQRREAAREMGRRKAAASRKARTRRRRPRFSRGDHLL